MKQYKTDNQLIYEAYISRAEFEKTVDFNNHTDDEKEFLNTLYELSSKYYSAVREVNDYIKKYTGSDKVFGFEYWSGEKFDLNGIYFGLKNIAKVLLKNALNITEETEENEINIKSIMDLVQAYSGIYDANGEYNLPGAFVFACDNVILAAFADINAFDKWVKHEINTLKASVDHSMVNQFKQIMNSIRSKVNAV